MTREPQSNEPQSSENQSSENQSSETSSSEPQARYDVLSDTWRLIAPSRAFTTFGMKSPTGLPKRDRPCPFCPGNEAETEQTVLQDPASGPWNVRVIKNRYPAVVESVSDHAIARDAARLSEGVEPALGVHEVVLESRSHDADWATLPETEAFRVVHVLQRRVRALETQPGIRYVSVFRNRGRSAGSSQPHPHAQVMALSHPAPEPQRRWAIARAHQERTGRNLFAEVVNRWLEEPARILSRAGDVVALCPMAPTHSFEAWIVPRPPTASFAATEEATLRELSSLGQRVVLAVLRAAGAEDYNLIWRLMPTEASGHPANYWYLQIAPRSGRPAGFELATGMSLCTVLPEVAAANIRNALS